MIRTKCAAAGLVENQDFQLKALHHKEVGKWVSACDAALFFIRSCYSKQASCPTKFGECLACGVPVVANGGVGDVGETLTIVLHNEIVGQDVSLAFPGHEGQIPDLTGVPQGGMTSYTFDVPAAGTFLYEAGLTSGGARQVGMGLAGPLIVEDPAATPAWSQEVLLVFDEIDSGIGGATAAVVGEKLRSLARYHQILGITHLPQIASCGETHFLVEKKVGKGRTRTFITPLDDERRVTEIARLLGGKTISEKTLVHAREMLSTSPG